MRRPQSQEVPCHSILLETEEVPSETAEGADSSNLAIQRHCRGRRLEYLAIQRNCGGRRLECLATQRNCGVPCHPEKLRRAQSLGVRVVLPSSSSRGVPRDNAEGADLKEPCHSEALDKCRVTTEGADSRNPAIQRNCGGRRVRDAPAIQ